MGAMVLRDVEPGAMVVGNPARLLERSILASA
jgi:acetyltransferase-like isoleucine patch superfamily enzyme